MKRTSKYINANFRIKVYGVLENGEKVNKLVGVTGIIEIIGVDFLNKFLERAEASMQDSCACKLRRGIKVTFYAK